MIYQFLITSFFEVVYFLKLGPIFVASYPSERKSNHKFLGKNLHLVDGATLCVKSEVMLFYLPFCIQERTKLRLEADTELQRQRHLDLQLDKEEERSVRQRDLQKQQDEHRHSPYI